MSKKTSDDVLKKALCTVLKGISSKWQLSDKEISDLLHEPEEVYQNWKLAEQVSFNGDGTYERILDFVDFYDQASSFFSKVEDQIGFLNSISSDFKYKSPLELIKEDFKNVQALTCFFSSFNK